MKALFRHNLKSYALVTALGLLAGFSVVLFIELPDNSFLSFYYWSSSTFGFWVFSTSLIVLFSESRKCAAINAGIYIFLMFLITTVHQSFRLYRSGATQFRSLSELMLNHIGAGCYTAFRPLWFALPWESSYGTAEKIRYGGSCSVQCRRYFCLRRRSSFFIAYLPIIQDFFRH